MNGSSPTRLPSTTSVSNVNEGEPTTWIVSGVTDCGATLSLKEKISGWLRATPAMLGRLKPTRTMSAGPLPPPPAQDTAENPRPTTAVQARTREIRMRIGVFLETENHQSHRFEE